LPFTTEIEVFHVKEHWDKQLFSSHEIKAIPRKQGTPIQNVSLQRKGQGHFYSGILLFDFICTNFTYVIFLGGIDK
jgi:hypothetical protein